MNVFGAFLTCVFCIGVVALPRPKALVLLICSVCYMTQGQELNLGLHFTAVRLVLLAGLLRIISRGELKATQFGPVDKSLFAYAGGLFLISSLRGASMDMLVYECGWLYNILLSYLVCRALLRDSQEIYEGLLQLSYVLLPLAVLMCLEANSGRNLFAIFGGVPEYSMFRDDHYRAEGPFRSPITAGSFGATLGLLYTAMLFARSGGRRALVGLVASGAIVFCARSSGPILGFGIGLVALSCWPLKAHTRKIRWGIVITLCALQMVMKAPVWFLLGRMSDIVGGGGYHRSYVIDRCINSFGTWWFDGMNSTGDWMPTQLADGNSDLTNQFVADCVNGGLLGLILSILVLVRCYKAVGFSMKQSRALQDLSSERMAWGMSAALTGSVGILFSVTYFDQMHVMWYFLLACIASFTSESLENSVKIPARHFPAFISDDHGPIKEERSFMRTFPL